MTLAPFTPDSLDELALRILDLAGTVRGMSNLSRENGLDHLSLHINKVREWMGRLEDWANDGAAKLETSVIKLKGARRAQASGRPVDAPRRGRPKGSTNKKKK